MKLETSEVGVDRLYIHQSDVDNFRKCPEQTRLKFNGDYFDPPSDSAFYGTVYHSFIEEVMATVKITGEFPGDVKLMDILAKAQQSYAEEWPNLWRHPHQIESLDQALEWLKWSCVSWWQNFKPRIEGLITDHNAIEIERPFEYQIGEVTTIEGPMGADSVQVWIRGTIDLVIGNTIIDHKTSKAPTGYNLWKIERYDIQSMIYSWALWQEIGLPPTFLYQHMPRGAHDKFAEVAVMPNQGGMEAAIQEALSWAEFTLDQNNHDTWPLGRSDWWCSARWCSEHAQGKCIGEHNLIMGDDAHNLIQLINKEDKT